MASPGAAGSIRLDKLLWFLRFARSRSIAQAMVAAGHIRLDGRRVSRSSCAVQAGATLVLPVGERIEVIRLVSLPLRRGPATEAQACYVRLSATTGSAAIGGDGNALHAEALDRANQ
ncbi:RNA-binding S4 domain-containing protein [Sphingopyxis alaskensis]|jgi:ribosome-associated heat shock protein Hsp15|uniref:RNA-binding S4 n=1 Tax=Sphingopyxis alaskensis (strain DSM 13593 / LMG 18877 / RB2256) TaxID=317655 RepID=Q1GPH7_SPHAL|nr:RNA-binding S4 domain-containing protein [Sphingopyxis alaskensis]ABF54445.1 RNA-binding S4 [Sphingopyxis alaskensis RB2256]MCM3417844.1 RNA-binding S4 domain-containing protein [Sphingopyxis alaskensis]